MRPAKKVRKCLECGGFVQPGYTELVYELQYRVRITNVPANICSVCGEAFISARVASEVNRLVNRVIEDVETFTRSQPQVMKTTNAKEIVIAV